MSSLLQKKPLESDFDYHKRIILGKLQDKTLSAFDYVELSKLVYGKEFSSDVARRMFYGSRYTLDLLSNVAMENVQDKELLDKIEAKLEMLEIEQQKFFDKRTAYKKLVRGRARQEELNDIIKESIKKGVDLPVLVHNKDLKHHDSETDVLISLNDIHYGAQVSNHFNKYDSNILRNMMQKYLEEILKIQATHQSERAIVWANGDLISGNIHKTLAITNKENVIEQVKGVSELIAQFLFALSSEFKEVVFVSVSGNHSRITPNKADALVGERLDDLIEWYLEARLSHVQNIRIDTTSRIDDTMYVIDVRGKKYAGVHGDFDGGTSKVQSLNIMAGQNLYGILAGHLHHNSYGVTQGIKTIMGGSFLGMDDYCVSKRIYGKPEQIVCICDENGVRCSYDVSLEIKR